MNQGDPLAEGPFVPEGQPAATYLWRLLQQVKAPDICQLLDQEAVSCSEATVLAVLRVDQRQRWLRGDRVCVEDYATRLPAAIDKHDLLLDLLASELLLRTELGAVPRLEDLVARFPQLAGQIEDRFAGQLEPSSYDTIQEAPASKVADTGQSAAETRQDPFKTLPSQKPPELAGLDREFDAAAAKIGYRIIDVLGAGGMGIVYQAYDTSLKREVALKMLLPDRQTGEEELSRFRLEAEVAAGLQHANIVQIYEISEHDGRLYMGMELVHGGSLAQRIKQQPLACRAAAELMETVALAIHHAHQHGVLHRDLKPANILLTRAGEPKVTDFGLAKRLTDEDSRTHSGAMLGTPCYMPPEQARGELKQLGPRSDVYSLGAVLYETLTGRPPFRGESLYDTLDLVCRSEPVAPSRLVPRLPEELETICLKCLAKEPGRRYASALALADDLRRFLNQEPIRARAAGPAERLLKWCRRRPALAALSCVCAPWALRASWFTTVS